MKKMNQKKKLTKKTAGAKLMMFLSVILFIVSGILPLTCNPFTVDVMWGQKKKPYLVLDHWILFFAASFLPLGMAHRDEDIFLGKVAVISIIVTGLYAYVRHIDFSLGLCRGVRLSQLVKKAVAYIAFLLNRTVLARKHYEELCDEIEMERDQTQHRSLEQAIDIYHMELFHATDIYEELLESDSFLSQK